jgi:FkbM family methyltransferase
MSLPNKILTALQLLCRLDFATFRRQWTVNRRQHFLRRQGSAPFVHHVVGPLLVCFPDHPDSVTQYTDAVDDLWELALLQAWLQPGDAFVDAGANLGLYSHAVAGHFGGTVAVLALEASPDLVNRLNIAAGLLGEKNLTAVQVAVGAESGEVTFHLARPGATTVSQSMQIGTAESGDYEPHVLPMRPLAALVAQHLPATPVAAVKIDVEGAEPLALRGAASAWLGADGPLWLVEVNLPVLARMNFKPGDVLRHFPATAFDLWLLPKYTLAGQPAARLRRLRADEAFADAAFYNLIAVPNGPAVATRRAKIQTFLR